MAFVVEDGTGKTDANSYITVAEMKEYWTDRGTDYTSLSDAVIQGYCINATQYINMRYSFKGYPTSETQALDFPRALQTTTTTSAEGYNGIIDTKYNRRIDTNEIPTTLKNACCEIAGASAVASTAGTTIHDNSGNNISSEKYGPVSVNYKGSAGSGRWGGSNSSIFVSYPTATGYIKGMLVTQGILRK